MKFKRIAAGFHLATLALPVASPQPITGAQTRHAQEPNHRGKLAPKFPVNQRRHDQHPKEHHRPGQHNAKRQRPGILACLPAALRETQGHGGT